VRVKKYMIIYVMLFKILKNVFEFTYQTPSLQFQNISFEGCSLRYTFLFLIEMIGHA